MAWEPHRWWRFEEQVNVAQSDFIHVYAIIRVEQDASPGEPFANWIKVKTIVATLEKAIAEVDRLNMLNSDKGCHYFWQVTKMDKTQYSLSSPVDSEHPQPFA